jgi:hypothetical protein
MTMTMIWVMTAHRKGLIYVCPLCLEMRFSWGMFCGCDGRPRRCRVVYDGDM